MNATIKYILNLEGTLGGFVQLTIILCVVLLYDKIFFRGFPIFKIMMGYMPVEDESGVYDKNTNRVIGKKTERLEKASKTDRIIATCIFVSLLFAATFIFVMSGVFK